MLENHTEGKKELGVERRIMGARVRKRVRGRMIAKDVLRQKSTELVGH